MAFVNALLTASENGNQHQPVPLEVQEFADRCDFSVIQINGQRFSTPKWTCHTLEGKVYVPPRGCEVYIGNIPRDCSEPDLLPVLQQIGPVFQFRLMMNFSGLNRGFAFVQFYNTETANLAVQRLDTYEIRPGSQISLKISMDSNRLLLTGVPKDKTAMDLYFKLLPLSPGLLYVTIERDIDIPKVCPADCGIVSLFYQDHRMAAVARSKVLAEVDPPLQLWGFPVQLDWAESILFPSCSEVHVLQVNNLSKETLTGAVKRIFNEASDNGVRKVLRSKRRNNKAVIYFKSRAQAEMAKVVNHERTIDGRTITVNWGPRSGSPSPPGAPGLHRERPVNNTENVFHPIQPIPAPGMSIVQCQGGFWTYLDCRDPNCPYNQPQPLPSPFQGLPCFIPFSR